LKPKIKKLSEEVLFAIFLPRLLTMEYLFFQTLPLYLAAYWNIEQGIKTIFQHLNPKFYATLYRSRKDSQYFVFLMGMLITITTTPLCYHAFIQTTPSNDVLGNPHPPSSSQLCLIPRGVLWASELNCLEHSNRYIVHHLSPQLSQLPYAK
jgi:hypothetical protein